MSRAPAKMAALLLAALPLGCTIRRVEAPAQPIQPAGDLPQRGLLPQDPYSEARKALAERYLRRERHFREAYAPGSLWRALRVEQSDIDAGRIKGAELVDIGRELFAIDFPGAQGLGNGLGPRHSPLVGPRPAPNLRHVHYKEFGGPDATRCLACHQAGGDGGGGFRSDNAFLDGDGATPASGLERNPPALLGAALVQRLAEEMSAELALNYRQARQRATIRGAQLGEIPLTAKGVSFGTLRFKRSGEVDPSGLRGVDADLVVRPFGRKGTLGTLREAVELSLQQNLGIQAERYLLRWHHDPGRVGDGPTPGDPDGDGIDREATDGMVTAMTTYLAALAPPIEAMPEDPSFLLRASRGAEFFRKIGCAGCHVEALPLESTVISLGPYPGSAPRLDLAPLLGPPGTAGRMTSVRLYSDLRRHDMGESLAEPRDYRGVRRREWLTPPLWGVAASGPYLHDGRAKDFETAILAHDGEARAARVAFQNLQPDDQGAVGLFLMALDRPHHLEYPR